MTKENILKMMEMRLDGCTFAEVGEHFGISAQQVSYLMSNICVNRKDAVAYDCVYPGLKKWMLEHYISANKMNADMGLYKTHQYFTKILTGKAHLTIKHIKAIIKYTGRSFEELFGGESE